MNQILKNFYSNEHQRETVKQFQLEVLSEMAVDAVFAGEDVKGFADAKKLIEKSFDKLNDMYGKIEGDIISNSK